MKTVLLSSLDSAAKGETSFFLFVRLRFQPEERKSLRPNKIVIGRGELGISPLAIVHASSSPI